jgi:hypothetical protein
VTVQLTKEKHVGIPTGRQHVRVLDLSPFAIEDPILTCPFHALSSTSLQAVMKSVLHTILLKKGIPCRVLNP